VSPSGGFEGPQFAGHEEEDPHLELALLVLTSKVAHAQGLAVYAVAIRYGRDE
jgi:hypothetical protein